MSSNLSSKRRAIPVAANMEVLQSSAENLVVSYNTSQVKEVDEGAE